MPATAEVYINPVTGERAVVREKPSPANGDLMVADLHLRPGGRIVGEHVHPAIEERFTVIRGEAGFRLGGRSDIARPGATIVCPAGVPHDWWNAGAGEALVRVEIRPGSRFRDMIMNLFGLARDGRTDRRGLPNPFQLALFAREFSDVVYFTRPPRAVQEILFAVLAPIGRLCGYRGSYPEYVNRAPSEVVRLDD